VFSNAFTTTRIASFQMNGFADHGLDEKSFGDKAGLTSGLRTFDAFRKSDRWEN
jgi:hypothetical protein